MGRARICADDDPGDLGLVAILDTQYRGIGLDISARRLDYQPRAVLAGVRGDQVKDAGNLGYFVLMYAQVFVLWHLILVWTGLRGAGKVSRSRATILVVIYALVSLGLRWIPTLISLTFLS